MITQFIQRCRSFPQTDLLPAPLPGRFGKVFYTLLNLFLIFSIFGGKKYPRALSSAEPKIPGNLVDAISLNLHESLHLVGLTHDEEDAGNIMYPDLSRGQVRREINEKEML